MKEPCKLKRVCLTIEGSTQTTPNKEEKSYCHKTLDLYNEEAHDKLIPLD